MAHVPSKRGRQPDESEDLEENRNRQKIAKTEKSEETSSSESSG